MTTLWNVALAVLLAAVIITDLRLKRIYNKVCVTLLLLGIASHLHPFNGAALLDGVITAAVAFVVLLFLYTMGGLRAGDVKFVTSVAVWFGYKGTLLGVLIGVLLTIAAASLTLMRRGRLFAYARNLVTRLMVPELRRHLVRAQFPDSLYVPLGAFIAIGFILVMVLGGGDILWANVVAKH